MVWWTQDSLGIFHPFSFPPTFPRLFLFVFTSCLSRAICKAYQQRHTNTGSTCPSHQGHCFQLTKPMTPFRLFPRKSSWPPPDLLQQCCPSPLNQCNFLRENLKGRLGVMVYQVSCSSSFQLFSSFIKLPQFPHSVTGCAPVFVQSEAPRVSCCSEGATCGSEPISGRPRKTGELSWKIAEALCSRRPAINLVYQHSAAL